MPRLYLIDGYNVLHRSVHLRPLLRHDFESARDHFVERVARFCAATGERAQVVFDGRGRRTETAPPLHKAPGLEVLYSPGHKSADAVIERQVYNTPDRRHVVVVSGDMGIRDLCRGLGALVMSPDNFLVTMREAYGATRATLEHARHANRPLRIEDQLSEETLRHLRALRKKLEG